jgi:hypothetical protein
MKKIVFLLFFSLATISAYGQKTVEPAKQNTTTEIDAVYRLFPTQNMYTFLKLDTRNGKIWQVQWDTDSTYRFVTVLSETALVYKEEEKNGRFTLYPTTNIYNFILLDQLDGKTWQVQWSQKKENRGVMPIY